METQTQEKPNELVVLIEQSGLEHETAVSLQEAFAPFKEQADKWLAKAKTLVVTDESQKHEMKEAGVARKALKEIRVNVEKRRKELKEDSLKKGKAIDSAAAYLKGLIEPIESHLEEQEKFAERKEAERKAQLKDSRTSALAEYGVDATFYDLANMPEDIYQNLFEQTKKAHDDKIEAERKAEEARNEAERQAEIERAEREEKQSIFRKRQLEIAPLKQFTSFELTLETTAEDFKIALDSAKFAKDAHEAEQARIAEENERLKREADEKERQLREERLRAEEFAQKEREENERKLAEQKAQAEAKAKREREEQEKKLAEERAERERVERELKEKQEAEERAKREERERAEAELSKGDEAKFQDFLNELESLKKKYSFKSKKYKDAYAGGVELLNRTINYLISKK